MKLPLVNKTVHIALVKDEDNVVQWIWVNASHQGSLREVATWMAPEVNRQIADYQLDLVEGADPLFKEESTKTIEKLRQVQAFMAQEKLEEAIDAFNSLDGKYIVELGEDPLGD